MHKYRNPNRTPNATNKFPVESKAPKRYT